MLLLLSLLDVVVVTVVVVVVIILVVVVVVVIIIIIIVVVVVVLNHFRLRHLLSYKISLFGLVNDNNDCFQLEEDNGSLFCCCLMESL